MSAADEADRLLAPIRSGFSNMFENQERDGAANAINYRRLQYEEWVREHFDRATAFRINTHNRSMQYVNDSFGAP